MPVQPGPRAGRRELIILLAAMMSVNSLAIDAMLPALPAIGQSLQVAAENDRQWVIVSYMIGFGAAQMLWGPLSDRFGRKPILLTGLAFYVVFALSCGMAGSFALLVTCRTAMGAAAAVTRVLITAMIRDLFDSEAMARVMSLTSVIFMLMPMIAPSIGQIILVFAPWPAIFWVLAGYGAVIGLWTMLRVPETLHERYRRSLGFRSIGDAMIATVSDRLSLGYTLAMTLISACLVAYIASIQQIVAEVFHNPNAIGIVFAGIALPMAIGSFGNSRIVERFGLRRVGHAGAIGFFLITAIHALLAEQADETLLEFVILQSLAMGSFAFTMSNFATLAMDHMADIAGTASAVQGLIMTIGGSLIGIIIGHAFNGSQLPFLTGGALCAAGSLLIVLATERGRLLAPMTMPAAG